MYCHFCFAVYIFLVCYMILHHKEFSATFIWNIFHHLMLGRDEERGQEMAMRWKPHLWSRKVLRGFLFSSLATIHQRPKGRGRLGPVQWQCAAACRELHLYVAISTTEKDCDTRTVDVMQDFPSLGNYLF